MANNVIISIKTSQSTATPPSLANGELAYSYSSNKLFIGQTDSATDAVSVEYIGGKLLVDKVANLESIVIGGSQVHANTTITGILTLSNYANNGVLTVGAGGKINSTTGSAYEVFQVAANGTPVFGDLNGGTF